VKKVGCLIFATAALLLVSALPADARSGGFKGHSSAGFAFKGHSNHGFKGHHHGFTGHHHHGFKGHHHTAHHFRSKVFVGVGVGVAPVWWWGWPGYYPYYRYPAYAAPVVIQQSPPVYIQQDQPAEPHYWYYCEGAQAYYPYVQQCPNGWMKVVPTPANGPKPNQAR
jgi:hypothetical protein